MRKFTLIQEDYDLDRFSITRSQFVSYSRAIEKIICELYPAKIKFVQDIKLIGPLNCEKVEKRDFSIFNKANTNVTLMKYFVRTFTINNFQELLSLVEDRKLEFFAEGGMYFGEVRKILKITEDYGDRNEYISIDFIREVIKGKLGVDIDPMKSPSGSYDDIINGIDITFKLPSTGKEYTCQVKPLVSITENTNEYIVKSSGNIKSYKTDYLSFSNHKTGETALFQNREVRINGTSVIIPKKYRVI